VICRDRAQLGDERLTVFRTTSYFFVFYSILLLASLEVLSIREPHANVSRGYPKPSAGDCSICDQYSLAKNQRVNTC
jgi:hypothetical protein